MNMSTVNCLTGSALIKSKKRLLAVTSGGGHWEQLMILRHSFDDFDVSYANTIAGLGLNAGVTAYFINDCNRNRPFSSTICALQLLGLIVKVRPHIVVSTGAAPGLIAVCLGKIFGAKVVWIDSIANSEKISLSGKMATLFADLHVSQWEHLATDKTVHLGGVL